ncbi:MAG: glycosyl hydrolase [Kastovskya adunca ATA6-11-RM4]|jgi:endoglucanase|nr:glycosyl hydrolase [Kastovskya adunca ATA6-11-RM4]
MNRSRWNLLKITAGCKFLFIFPAYTFILFSLAGCFSDSQVRQPETPPESTPVATVSPVVSRTPSLPSATENQELLQQSWEVYKQRFIQDDGRVIDREASDRSISEAQAYAMLRAVLIDDPTTFAKTLDWAEKNLRRQEANGQPGDRLWAWKWGRDKTGKWGVIDRNFASDADIDAITALIFAARRWNRPEYLELARGKLQDLWEYSTVTTANGRRYLLPGPQEAFVKPPLVKLNPSYLAPYAFRLFAQVDGDHDWMSLVDSSYYVLENAAQISAVKLPSDWVALDTETGLFQSVPQSSPLHSQYGFDAYRVWWRVALDAAWFESPEALQFLRQHLGDLQERWRSEGKIPAQINLQGQPTVDYESTSQYAMLYAALRLIDSETAEQIRQRKLLTSYKEGVWDNDMAYYVQNLAWLGLLPPTTVTAQLLDPDER